MSNKKILDKVRLTLLGKIKSHDRLIQLLYRAKDEDLLDSTALTMIEGVLQISEMQARNIMIPRSQMAVIHKESSLDSIIKLITETTHSRFPVIDDDLDDVDGIVLAKDFLPYAFDKSKNFDLRSLIRPAIFIPESKRLNSLLQEFRDTQNHMAIVVDEFGGVSGLVTIEDVLEQIVGEIEDEYDVDDENFITHLKDNTYIIKGITPIENFNEHFDVAVELENCDTIGGLVMRHFGHVPKRGETIQIKKYQFKVLHADSRHLRTLELIIV